MQILIVYGTQFGNTKHLAWAMAGALRSRGNVQVVAADEAPDLAGFGVDLLLVGAPTQIHGLRLLVRSFTSGLERHGFAGVPAAAFDTRLAGAVRRTGSEAQVIAKHLESAGCQVLAPPESFIVEGAEGPPARGEEARARAWALGVLETLTLPMDASR